MADMESYDPLGSVEIISSENAQELETGMTTSASYDPLGSTEIISSPNVDSNRPINGQVKPEKYFPLRGWEQDVAKVSSTLYAAARLGLDMIPYASYLAPSKRDEFMSLSQQEQTAALLYEALGAALWGKGEVLAKGIGAVAKPIGSEIVKPILSYGARKTGLASLGRMISGQSKAVAEIIPYEDAAKAINSRTKSAKISPYSYAEDVKGRLLRRGLTDDEAEATVGALTGDEAALTKHVMESAYEGKELSEAFKKTTDWQKGRLYPQRILKDSVKKAYDFDILQGKHYGKQFETMLNREVLHAKPAKNTTKAVFETHARRVFPDKMGEGGKLDFGDFTPEQMGNIMLDMVENKGVAWSATYPKTMATLRPARVVFGSGEKALGTLTNIQIPVKGALGRTNRNYFNHSLLFAKMLEQRGAYQEVIIKETGEFSVKRAKWLTNKVLDEAYQGIRQLDEFSTMARKAAKSGDDTLIGEMKSQVSKTMSGMSKEAQILLSTWQSYSDHLYVEHVKLEIPRLFSKAGLTRLGQSKLDELMTGPEGLSYELDNLFSSMSQASPTEKMAGMRQLLTGVRKRLDAPEGNHPYFRDKGDKLVNTLKRLDNSLDLDQRNGFLNYYENYVARVSQHEDILLQKWRGGLFKGRQAFHTKIRELEKLKGEPVSFGQMIEARTMAHAKEHYLYDELDKVVKFTEKLPPAWVEYTEGYLGGVLGTPTLGDYKVAMFLTKTVGGVERLIGKEGLWSEQRTMDLAYSMQKLSYLGALGFKPFSALRNLFQPLMTVPADLGGVKDLGSLVSGIKWSANPKNVAYLKQLGLIEEYLPEIYLRPKILGQSKLDSVYDMGLWMFKTSDRWSRYAAGGAAHQKWEKILKGFQGKVSPEDVTTFGKKLRLGGRYEWDRANIEDLLYRGKLSEAKATFIKSVVGDTQYLYGVADAPVALRKYGVVGRTGFQFQSWWMNYGQLLEKWMTTGESPGQKAERIFTAMLSQGLAYSMMEPIWGKQSALKASFLGPFPSEFNEFLVPPTWKPVYHAVSSILNIQNPEVSERHAKAVLSTGAIFIPGSSQGFSTFKGAQKEGFPGFAKSIVGMKPVSAAMQDEDEEEINISREERDIRRDEE